MIVGPKTFWGLVGLVPLVTGAIGFCPISRLFGITTCPVARSSAVDVEIVRNEAKRLRVGRIAVTLDAPGADLAALEACIPAFEEFCTVTQSVREGIDVAVQVRGST